MRSRRQGAFVLACLLILLPFPAVTQADSDDISLQPQTPHVCDTLTAIWPHTTATIYSVAIADNDIGQTLFQTNITGGPTPSIQWVVSATGGAQLRLAVHTAPNFGNYRSTNFTVVPGAASCPRFPQNPLVCCAQLSLDLL